MYVDKYEEKVNTILRIVIGFVFLYASLTKLFSEQPFYGFINATTIVILIIGLIELIVGVFLIVGLFTRLVSIVGGILVMLYIVLSIPAGLFHEYFMWKDVAILGGLIVLSLEREYLYSLDEVLHPQMLNAKSSKSSGSNLRGKAPNGVSSSVVVSKKTNKAKKSSPRRVTKKTNSKTSRNRKASSKTTKKVSASKSSKSTSKKKSMTKKPSKNKSASKKKKSRRR